MTSAAEHARIFGPREIGESGKARLCRSCGGWHRTDRAWPHNCRAPAPPRNRNLAVPQLAPRFEAFVAGTHDEPVVISDHRDKRAYMDRHDLVEYDAGVRPEADPTPRQWVEDFAQDFKLACETDPLNRPPTEIVGRTDLDGAAEIDPSKIEVFE